MLKVCHVSSWWFLYLAGQMLKKVIAIFAAPGFSSFSPRYTLGTGVQGMPGKGWVKVLENLISHLRKSSASLQKQSYNSRVFTLAKSQSVRGASHHHLILMDDIFALSIL